MTAGEPISMPIHHQSVGLTFFLREVHLAMHSVRIDVHKAKGSMNAATRQLKADGISTVR